MSFAQAESGCGQSHERLNQGRTSTFCTLFYSEFKSVIKPGSDSEQLDPGFGWCEMRTQVHRPTTTYGRVRGNPSRICCRAVKVQNLQGAASKMLQVKWRENVRMRQRNPQCWRDDRQVVDELQPPAQAQITKELIEIFFWRGSASRYTRG